ncbi:MULTISPECIES: DUF3800 domain-containing protein [unclassified Microbacterium]|uniref:DUF3800 domain-containing protein n=1 Tax=unclassified Microbacterium TaxID=2609290 RepID=UPI0004938F9E|nr:MULTISPECIES: DUF3800 domain-containing protein [unclassified Microbacterium]
MPAYAKLPKNHPVATCFLDETGSISNDRFFGVGLVSLEEPSRLLRSVQNLRDRKHWYNEFHFSSVTRDSLEIYKQLVDLSLAVQGFHFYCFIADRTGADPVERFGDRWTAYLKMSEQLVVASFPPGAVVSVVADNYSTPASVLFEEELRYSINRRFRRLAVQSVYRADSHAFDGLQVVDLFTSAAAFEFRANAGLASHSSEKGKLAAYVRESLGTETCLTGWRNSDHSIQIYNHGHGQVAP